MTLTFKDATFYTTSEFIGNVIRHDCRDLTIETAEYAQYKSALLVKFLERGKRKWRGFYLTYKPFLVILPTAQAIEPDSMYARQSDGSGISRHRSFADEWVEDFDAKLKAAGVTPLADFRNHNTSDAFTEVA